MNKFARLRLKIESIKQDIWFLKSCKRLKVFPKFMKMNCAVNNARSNLVMEKSKWFWLQTELSFHYSRLSELELKLYSLHLSITRGTHAVEIESWNNFLINVEDNVLLKISGKKQKLNRKLNDLTNNGSNQLENAPRKPEFVDDFVVNQSTCTFSDDEINLLNKGLNFAPLPKTIDILESIVDIEANIRSKPFSIQNNIRETIKPVLENFNRSPIPSEIYGTVNGLKQKDVVYCKADKGNKVVILDKNEYDNRMLTLIDESSYKKLRRNPLSKMEKEAKEMVKEISREFGDRLKWSLTVPNAKVPKLYGLPKIHKAGNKMRPIVASIDAPTQKLSKWLVNQFKTLPPIESLSVKNSFEFAEKIKNLQIANDELMVSFDVTSLFPSIPVEEAIHSLEEHLTKHNVPPDKKQIYIKATKLCMGHNICQFRNNFYKIESGTTMGNSLSPLLAEFFMAKFEIDLKERNLLPKVWLRYVDDVFAIIKQDDLEQTLNVLNNQYNTIKFTVEKEENDCLPFLDLKLCKVNGKLDISVYHKPTSTLRYITSDSHCPRQHKMAAFHSMAYRLCKLPLSINSYMREHSYIMNVAKVNGYKKTDISKIIEKHSRRVRLSELTTLFSQNRRIDNASSNIAVFNYNCHLTNKISTEFKKLGYKCAFKSKAKLTNLLGNAKDKTDNNLKAGIYEITCNNDGCGAKYYGQTTRNVKTRFSEHLGYIRNNHQSKSEVALHAHQNLHLNLTSYKMKLIKEENSKSRLDIYESYFIKKSTNSMNTDDGNVSSTLFNLI